MPFVQSSPHKGLSYSTARWIVPGVYAPPASWIPVVISGRSPSSPWGLIRESPERSPEMRAKYLCILWSGQNFYFYPCLHPRLRNRNFRCCSWRTWCFTRLCTGPDFNTTLHLCNNQGKRKISQNSSHCGTCDSCCACNHPFTYFGDSISKSTFCKPIFFWQAGPRWGFRPNPHR